MQPGKDPLDVLHFTINTHIEDMKDGEEWFSNIFPSQINPFTEFKKNLILVEDICEYAKPFYYNEGTRFQYVDRFISISRSAYVNIFSVAEYSLKQIIRECLKIKFIDIIEKWNIGKYVSLNSILNRLDLDSSTRKKWKVHQEIRNCIVHNNATFHTTKQFNFDGFHLETNHKYQLSGKLEGYLIMSSHLSNLFMGTLNNILKQR